MAKLIDHVYAIKNLLSKGASSSDDRYTEAFISYILNIKRAQLIKDKLNKYGVISPFSYQTICVPMELTTYHDCDCIPADLGCKILKSTCTIPRDLISKWGSSLVVKKPSGEVINMTSITKNNLAQYSQSNNPPSIGWFVEDGHIIILNNTNLQVALLTAIWEDPNKVKNFCTCGPHGITTTPCYDPLLDEYPIDADLVSPMIQMTVEQILQTVKLPEDNLINAKDVEIGPDKEN